MSIEIKPYTRHCVGDVIAYERALRKQWGGQVVGRIDTTLIASRFDGSIKAYLDWICVLKSHRHRGVGQELMETARGQLRAAGATDLVAIIAQNDEAQRFYRGLTGAVIRDAGIWITL